LRIAAKRLPETAVFLPVDKPAYDAASAQVMAALRSFPVDVEVLGWDEAFVGIDTDDPHAFARHIQAEVLAATSLHCSVGVGDTKVRAKIATDFGKPRGVYQLTRANWFEVMGDRPTDAIWGIGTRIKARLAELGIDTVHDLATADEERLVTEFGPTMGPHFGRLGRGVSSAVVDDTPYVPRAHGRETTYQQNLTDPDEIAAALRVLADQVVEDIGREGRACMRVHLKVRFAPFFTFTRIRKLPEPTFDAAVITATALELLHKLEDDRPIRLLGVRAEMTPPEGGY
jgi:DNA polymerase-4